MELKGRQVLVTGAGRGIGRAFALMCAREGTHLHLLMRKRDVELETELKKLGAKSVQFWQCDLSSRENVQVFLKDFSQVPIEVVFNNAGVLTGGLLEEQTSEEIHNLFQVNVLALIDITRGVLPGMLSRKRGKIINNSSVSAFMNFPCASTYAASKAAVAALTQSLKLELKGTGVTTLLLITPGIKTNMFDEIPKLYGKNFEVSLDSISPNQYAEMIREAIFEDLDELRPSGLTGWGLRMAQWVPRVFEAEVSRRFRR